MTCYGRANAPGQRGVYLYQAIATNLDEHGWSCSEVVHWYNQCAESSENRLKELRRNFAGARLRCGQFHANAAYFKLVAMACNLMARRREETGKRLARQARENEQTLYRWRDDFFAPVKVRLMSRNLRLAYTLSCRNLAWWARSQRVRTLAKIHMRFKICSAISLAK